MRERLAKALVASIKSGKYDEALATSLGSNNSAIETLKQLTLSSPTKVCETELQLSILFKYLAQIVQSFGAEDIRPWHGMILGTLAREGILESLHTALVSLCQLAINKEASATTMIPIASTSSPTTHHLISIDRTISPNNSPSMHHEHPPSPIYGTDHTTPLRQKILNLYLSKSNSTIEKVLIDFAESHTLPFSNLLCGYLDKHEHTLPILNLIYQFSLRQGPHLHQIAESALFGSIVLLLRNTTETQVMSKGLFILSELLPCICRVTNVISNNIHHFLAILKRALLWNQPEEPTEDKPNTNSSPPEISKILAIFLRFLFRMFPSNTFKFLQESSSSLSFRILIEPLMVGLPLLPLFLAKEDNELSASRWINREPHTIVTECLGLSCGCQPKRESVTEALFNEINKDPQKNNKTEEVDKYVLEVGDSIQRLQNILENKLCVSDLHNLATESTEPENAANVSHSVPSLMKQVLLLKNELLYERYLRHKYLRQYTALNRDLSQLMTTHMHLVSRQESLADYQQQFERMNVVLQGKNNTIAGLHEHNENQVKQLTEKIKILSEEKNKLSELVHSLQTRLQQRKQLVQQQKRLIEEKDALIFNNNAHLNDLQSKASQVENLRKQVVSFKEEIVLWEIKYKAAFESMSKVNAMMDYISMLSKTNEGLNLQLSQMQEKLNINTNKLCQSLQRIRELEKQKEEKAEIENMQKNLIEYQRNLSANKLKAMEEKYNYIKSINTGLERRLQELEAELEKYQQLVNKMAPSSALTLSELTRSLPSPTPSSNSTLTSSQQIPPDERPHNPHIRALNATI